MLTLELNTVSFMMSMYNKADDTMILLGSDCILTSWDCDGFKCNGDLISLN